MGREKQKAINQGKRADGGHLPTIIRGKGSRRVIMGGSSEGQEDIRQVMPTAVRTPGMPYLGESIGRSTLLSLRQDQAISGAIGNQALYSKNM